MQCPAQGNQKFTTFRYTKAKIETNKITQGNTFIKDLLKLFLDLKICGGLKPPTSPWCYDPGMYNVKEKDDRMDQNTLQYCYSHYVTANQQT